MDFHAKYHLIQLSKIDMQMNELTSLNSKICIEPFIFIQIFFSDIGDITQAHYNCARGQVRCHRMATLLIYAYKNIFIGCSWSKKIPPPLVSTKTIDELYPVPLDKVDYCPIKINDDNTLKSDVYSELTNLHCVVGLTWLLSPEPSSVPLVELEDILRSEEFEKCSDKQQYLLDKVSINNDDIVKLALNTVGQDLNSLWLVKRRYRITASNFGPVLCAINRNKYPPSLFKRLVGTYKLDGVKSIQWGKENEKHGILEFEKFTGKEVTNMGYGYTNVE